jgi:hypothetical protein
MKITKNLTLRAAALAVCSLLPLSASSITITRGGAGCSTPGGPAGLCTSLPGATTVHFDGFNTGTLTGPRTRHSRRARWPGTMPRLQTTARTI